jgi:hypothetical protein
MDMFRSHERLTDLLEMEIDRRSNGYHMHFVTREEFLVIAEPASNPKFLGRGSGSVGNRITNRRQGYALSHIRLHQMSEDPQGNGSTADDS